MIDGRAAVASPDRTEHQVSGPTSSQPDGCQIDTALQYQLNHRRLNPRQVQLSSIAGAIGAYVVWPIDRCVYAG
jgi:hypothetical protein